MTYSTLMVQLELGRSNSGLLAIAANLAEGFHASVIGIAGSQVVVTSYNDGIATGEVILQDIDESKHEIQKAETEFRDNLQSLSGRIEWRSTLMAASLCDYIVHEARSADLVITSMHSGEMFDDSRYVNTGELLMQLGRPVLLVPSTASSLTFDHIIIAWNDTRESRRATSDALPVLKKASHVTIVELAPSDELNAAKSHVKAVSAWLQRHGVTSECNVLLSVGDDATQLSSFAREHGANLIVSGAYGHSRMREFVFGGVTRNLLQNAAGSFLMSH